MAGKMANRRRCAKLETHAPHQTRRDNVLSNVDFLVVFVLTIASSSVKRALLYEPALNDGNVRASRVALEKASTAHP